MSVNAKPNQWMPVHIDDFMSRTQHLSTEEKGAYLLMLFNYWRNQEPLPDNDKHLARIAGVTPESWSEMALVIRQFFHVKDGKLHQKRIDKEIAKAVGISEKRQMAGRRGGQSSSNSRSKKEANASANGQANGVAGVNTRACNGLQSVASSSVRIILDGDDEIERLISRQESEWYRSPEAVKARSDARKNRFQGVS